MNEYSARYSVLDREFYLPEPEQLKAQARVNRQGRGEALAPDEAARVLDLLRGDAERTYADYAWMLNEGEDGTPTDPARDGLARELARINLTLGTYTQWYWKTNLHNLMNFLRLPRRSSRPVRNPRLRRGDDRDDGPLGADHARGVSRASARRRDVVTQRARGGAADDGGGGGERRDERAWHARMAGAGGGVGTGDDVKSGARKSKTELSRAMSPAYI